MRISLFAGAGNEVKYWKPGRCLDEKFHETPRAGDAPD
jgi:hypothetical protein